MLEVKGLTFTYQLENQVVEVLKALDFKVTNGEFVAIQGPSGSGKSTLFYILGLLLQPTAGRFQFAGETVTDCSADELTLIRNRRIGFVFQQFHLLSKATVLENILIPTHYPSELAEPSPTHRARAEKLATDLGLGKHLHHRPNQLSGGQQQRVAIARALMHEIDLILADEPTGNLDSQSAHQILDLLQELNQRGKTIVLITHDAEVAKRCGKVYHLKDGAFTHVVENFAPHKVLPSEARATSPSASARLPLVYSLRVYRRIVRSVFPLVKENLLRNRAKSLLTMLGVVIGIAAVLAMITLGRFTERKILQTYENLGVNKIVLRGYPNWNLKSTDAVSVRFKAFNDTRDLGPLKRIFPQITHTSPLQNSWGTKALAGGLMIEDNVTLIGVSAEYLAINNRSVQTGRGFSPFHIENRSPVCLIGSQIVERIFPRTQPVGQVMHVTNGQRMSFPCQVIGVLNSVTSNNESAPFNRYILTPYTYFQVMTDNPWDADIHQVGLRIAAGVDVESTGRQIQKYFQSKYGRSGNFMIDSDSTLISQMKRFLSLFSVLLAGIAFLSLVVGGIGINNMMLVSVSERVKEFGLRKALGATHRSIRVQVLLESLTLCGLAGVIGVGVGFGAYQLLIFGATHFVPQLKFEWVFEPFAVLLSVVSIIGVGIASGLIPALRAEKLQVIEALRSD